MQKAVTFHWSTECQEASQALKKRLVERLVLVYPDFTTGSHSTSYKVLEAVLSQRLGDHQWLSLAKHY